MLEERYGSMVTPLESEIRKLLEDARPTEELMAKLGTGVKDFENDPEFVAGYLKDCLVRDVLMAMKEEGMNRHQLAERLGKSRQYVSRILNETANFTLQSVAELACALGRKVEVSIHPIDQRGSVSLSKQSRRRTKMSA